MGGGGDDTAGPRLIIMSDDTDVEPSASSARPGGRRW
jgi:hypothetical protein